MKNNRIILYMLSFLSLSLFSCEEELTQLNIDPNSSPSATPDGTFVSALGFYGFQMEMVNETNAMLAQYWAGGPGVSLIDTERYFFVNGDFDGTWGNLYAQVLSDLKYTIDYGNEAQAAAAHLLSASAYQTLVDLYGDVPYTEALRGAPEDGSIVNPAYDDAKTVYDSLVVRVDIAIGMLSSTADELGDEDMLYGGDISKWIAFGNSLKLKLLMRQSITDPSVGAAVVSLIQNGTFIGSEDEMLAIPFGGAEGQNFNPQYARREAGVGQFYVASTSSTDIMEDLEDPRLMVLYDSAVAAGAIVGLKQGDVRTDLTKVAADYSFPSEVAYAEDNSVIIMSHWEVMFLRAEAAMRFGTADNDKEMFDNAIRAHFDYIGAEGVEDYLTNSANYATATNDNQKSNLIGLQKWISMNGLQETEGWIESRRFDTTAGNNLFTGPTGVFNVPTESVFGPTTRTFPSIYLYPGSELAFNATNTSSSRTITDKVFWDN